MVLPNFQLRITPARQHYRNLPKPDEVYLPGRYKGKMASASSGSLFKKSSAKTYDYVRKSGIKTLFILHDPIYSDHATILKIVHSHLILSFLQVQKFFAKLFSKKATNECDYGEQLRALLKSDPHNVIMLNNYRYFGILSA